MKNQLPTILVLCGNQLQKYFRNHFVDFADAEIVYNNSTADIDEPGTKKEISILIIEIDKKNKIPSNLISILQEKTFKQSIFVLYVTQKSNENLNFLFEIKPDFFDVLQLPLSREIFIHKIKLFLQLYTLRNKAEISDQSLSKSSSIETERNILESEKNLLQEVAHHQRTKIQLQDKVQKIDDSSHFLEMLIESIPIPIFIKNNIGEYIKCNKAFENFIGYHRKNFLGKTIHHLSSIEYTDKIHHLDLKIIKSGESKTYEETYKKIDGSLVKTIVHLNVFENKLENTRRLIGIIVDITKIKRAEKLLKIESTINYLISLNKGIPFTLKNIMNHLMELEWIDIGGIYLYNEKKQELNLVYSSGVSKAFTQTVETYGKDTPQMKLVLKRKPFYGHFQEIVKKNKFKIREDSLKLFSVIPLINTESDSLIGCLNLASRKYTKITDQDKLDMESITQRLVRLMVYAQSQNNLKELTSQLENKVKEKTKVLRETNQQLKEEINFHKNTKDTLDYTESIYRNIFEHAPGGIILYDAETMEIVDINKTAHNDLGYSRSEFMKLEIEDFTIYEDGDAPSSILQKLFVQGKNEYHVKQKKKDGTFLFRQINVSVINIRNKKYILEVIHDTTGLTLKEIEIGESKQKYRQLQENVPIGIFTTIPTGKIIYINKAVVSMFRYESAKEMRLINAQEYYHNKSDRNKILGIIGKDGYVNNIEVRLKRKDRSVFWGVVSMYPIYDNDGKLFQFDGIIEDITERKNSENKLQQANRKIQSINKNLEKRIEIAVNEQKLNQQYLLQKSKLESLGELSAGIAHEINQPLGVLALSLENLQGKIGTKLGTKEYLANKFNSIEDNIKKIRQIIDHIRTFSRDQELPAMEKVNLNKVVNKALSLIGTQYMNLNINIKLDLKEKIGFTIGSNIQVEQVILNLLSNAKYAIEDRAKFMDEMEFTKEIIIRTDSTAKNVILEIEDNGTGIGKIDLPKIYDPFYTTKPEGDGTGVGLSIAYGIIKSMRGDIFVASKKNKYTKFEIFFPKFPEKN